MISIVIPSYNRSDLILALLRDIHAQQDAEFEVIVVDDCSPDDSVAAIRREFPQVQVLVNEKNSGPAVARNRGVLAAKGEFIVGFDSDVTIPDQHLLKKIGEAFQNEPSVACLALRILKPDGKSDDVERWCHPLPLSLADHPFFTSYFSGTAYAMRRESMIRAGLYPEIFYMHHEEVELAFRLLDQGDSIRHCPDLSVLHHASPISARSYVETFYHPRNQILLVLLSYPFFRGIVHLLPRTLYQCGLALKGGHFKNYWSAIRDGIYLARPTLQIRKPLKASTFDKILKLKRQAVPPILKASSALPTRGFSLTDPS
ncbi:MAG: glycosyltransferase [Verrucomicrobiota bacterium]